MHSVCCGRSSEGAPKKTSSRRSCSSKKKIYKTTSDVPEIKLFKLFIIGLKKKYNGEAALSWSHFIFFLSSNSVTT